jgi:signal transduction histidine kinase
MEGAITRRQIAVALAALAAGVAVVVAVVGEGRESAFEAALGVGIGWSFVASGIVAWARRPEISIGRVMVLGGFLRVGAEFCAGSADPVLYPVGHLFHLGFFVAVGYVVLAFPSGRLNSTLSRWIMAGASLFLPLWAGWVLLGGEGHSEILTLTEDPDGASVFARAEMWLGVVLGAMIIVALVRRWRNASARVRFATAPVLWVGAAGFVVLLLRIVDSESGQRLGAVPDALFDVVIAGVAVGFLVGLLRARLARSAVAELVVELGDTTAPGDLRDALARALRDPSLALAYWLPDDGRYVDVDGRPLELPGEGEPRAVSMAERDGRRVAALVHDPALGEEPELVQSVCAAAALALENERLQAELKAHLEELRASRARIVEAADEERRRIERNLHDGTQQRLVSISMALGLAEAKARSDPAAVGDVVSEARAGVSAALAELRELSHGIHPAVLTERGLAAALEELAVRATLPVELSVDGRDGLSEPVEAAAYYVVSETLANVAKHAHATRTRVAFRHENGKVVLEVADDGIGGADVGRGSGLRGLTDRVEALGGGLWLSSPTGEGTIVRAEIPCA